MLHARIRGKLYQGQKTILNIYEHCSKTVEVLASVSQATTTDCTTSDTEAVTSACKCASDSTNNECAADMFCWTDNTCNDAAKAYRHDVTLVLHLIVLAFPKCFELVCWWPVDALHAQSHSMPTGGPTVQTILQRSALKLVDTNCSTTFSNNY